MSPFRQSVEAMIPALRRYARALARDTDIADDLVQDTLLRLWTKREDIAIPDKAEAFAVIALRNLFYDQRRKKHLLENDDQPQEHQIRTDKDASDELESKIEVTRVQQIIDRLPEKQRLVITLHDIDNLSYEEIEAQTGLNAINIRVALSRARKNVREQF